MPHDDVVGAWTTADGRIIQYLDAEGRYDETRDGRAHAYTGSYVVTGSHLDYRDDTGFSATGDVVDGVLFHEHLVLHRLPDAAGTEPRGPLPSGQAALDDRSRVRVDIAAAAAAGGARERLARAVDRSLDLGLRPEQVIEVLIHIVPFAGFARALGALPVTREVFERRRLAVDPVRSTTAPDRYDDGLVLLRRVAGQPAELILDSLRDQAPDLARLVVEITYGDVYSRPGLDTDQRLLVTITALAAMGDTAPLLDAQLRAARARGWSPSALRELVLRAVTERADGTAAEALAAWEASCRPRRNAPGV